jgi:hypothetical protein
LSLQMVSSLTGGSDGSRVTGAIRPARHSLLVLGGSVSPSIPPPRWAEASLLPCPVKPPSLGGHVLGRATCRETRGSPFVWVRDRCLPPMAQAMRRMDSCPDPAWVLHSGPTRTCPRADYSPPGGSGMDSVLVAVQYGWGLDCCPPGRVGTDPPSRPGDGAFPDARAFALPPRWRRPVPARAIAVPPRLHRRNGKATNYANIINGAFYLHQ